MREHNPNLYKGLLSTIPSIQLDRVQRLQNWAGIPGLMKYQQNIERNSGFIMGKWEKFLSSLAARSHYIHRLS